MLNTINGVRHGFGCRDEPLPSFAAQFWLSRPTKKQVHGTKIAVALHTNQSVGEADGWYTLQKRILLTLVNADCYPVLFARKDGSEIAALHVGWRGAYHGIIYGLNDLIRSKGDDMAGWIAAIGPGARACCYQVSDTLLKDFSSKFNLPNSTLSPSYRMLDLPAVIAFQLQEIGIGAFEDLNQCTVCSSINSISPSIQPTYHSYRRDHTKEVQVSFVVME
ncbi:polyphenol oxidase family protein [Advenella incenata]|uniref:polyphenol oxidase family protein n=1 Tax=Advenella incenata TaxID=267800 RepID=UPI0013EEB154|nr:laccase domain-containing protein [Advenella incenata]